MSFEDALLAARAELSTPAPLPAFARVEAAVRCRQASAAEARPAARLRWLATLGATVALLTMVTDAAISLQLGAPLFGALLLPVALLGLSAVAVHRATLSAQLVSRAVWWAYLVLGAVWSLGPAESLPVGGTIIAIASGGALLAAGRAGLRRADTAAVFDPVAFRGIVLLSMILGLADVQLLTHLGLVYAEAGVEGGHPVALLTCAALLGVGVWGLSRLRVWAVGLNLAVNGAVLVLLLSVVRHSSLLAAVAASAAVQLLLPLRMLVAFWRGAAPSDRGRELSAGLAVVIIVALMLLSVPLGLLRTYASLVP